jgi:hypothetical protein
VTGAKICHLPFCHLDGSKQALSIRFDVFNPSPYYLYFPVKISASGNIDMLLPSRRSTASPHHPCGRAPVCFLLNLQILPPRRRCTSTPLPPKLRIRAQRPGRTTWPDGGCGGHSGKLRQKQRQAHSSSRKAAAGSQQKQNDGDKQCKQHDAAGMSISISLR